jgi:peptidoglycan/xylan/chitin deacetylase (PgdA/CDA1 family)
MFFRSLLLSGLFVCGLASPQNGRVHKRAPAQVYSSCVNPNQVALTFDDGPWIYHRQISDLFTNAGAKTTFFMNGNNFGCIYDNADDIRYAFNAGHMVASHTWQHGDLSTFSYEQVVDAMYRTEEALSRIVGVLPGLMRPPYGSYNDQVRQVSGDRNQAIAMWDFDSGDSTGASAQQSKQLYADAVNRQVSNLLTLNHEVIESTVNDVIPYAINLLQSAGYQLVTVAECLGVPAYTAVGTPQARDASWTCSGTPAPGQGCSGNCKSGPVFLQGGNGGGGGGSNPPTDTTGKSIRPGNAGGQCLTASNSDGGAVTIQGCTGADNQKWSYTGGALRIFGNQCLDVPSGNTTPGQKLQTWTCYGGNTNQQWYVTGDQRIAWTNHGECMDLTDGNTSSGNLIQVWTCTDRNANQVWNFV